MSNLHTCCHGGLECTFVDLYPGLSSKWMLMFLAQWWAFVSFLCWTVLFKVWGDDLTHVYTWQSQQHGPGLCGADRKIPFMCFFTAWAAVRGCCPNMPPSSTLGAINNGWHLKCNLFTLAWSTIKGRSCTKMWGMPHNRGLLKYDQGLQMYNCIMLHKMASCFGLNGS